MWENNFRDFTKIILGRCSSFRQCKKQELTPILGKLFQLQKATRVETSSTAIDAGATDRSRRWKENEYDACLFVNGVKNREFLINFFKEIKN